MKTVQIGKLNKKIAELGFLGSENSEKFKIEIVTNAEFETFMKKSVRKGSVFLELYEKKYRRHPLGTIIDLQNIFCKAYGKYFDQKSLGQLESVLPTSDLDCPLKNFLGTFRAFNKNFNFGEPADAVVQDLLIATTKVHLA